ncbi:MAG TPA: DUF3472 domain-containing protein [Puia sp.]|nr:DUF3472 domain-containing protein [Puia sp.]
MKYILSTILLFFSCFVSRNAISQSNSLPDTTNTSTVDLFGNAYTYPQALDEEKGPMQPNGLTAWEDKNMFTRVYFYPQQTGNLRVRLKTKAPWNSGRIRISLDGSAQGFEVKVNRTSDYVILPAGDFMIDSPRYHYLEIKGLNKAGRYFPAIAALLLTGDAARNLKFNTSAYRGAASTHLRYESPKDSIIAWFYSEVTVPPGVNAVNAYYQTNGFADGYMGIQVNSDTERRFIFSVWSNYKTDNPKEIPNAYAVKLIDKGSNVFSDQFGNEGSGGHSHLVFPWRNGTRYKLLVGAKPAGDHTIFTGYYFAPENGSWKLLARWDKSKTEGKQLSGLYAFVENFGPNGDDFFKAYYGNQWICTPSGTWIELTTCHFTTTAGPVKHPRYDYGAGVENNWFYMFSGGFKELNNLSPHALIRREANAVPPDIDFSSLPEQ